MISHDDGYETQYCHLAQGSISVRSGEWVEAKQPIGRVGLSGRTQFPHVHLTLRKDSKAIDPFSPLEPDDSCQSKETLWSPTIPGLEYRPAAVLNTGFAPNPVQMSDVEDGSIPSRIENVPDTLVAYVRVLGLQTGDVQRLTMSGPSGQVVDSGPRTVDSNKAQSLIFVGRKLRREETATGIYTASFSVTRKGSTIITTNFTAKISDPRNSQ